jgi:hypothetical protein
MTWPDDLWRTELSAEQILRILGSDVTFRLELHSGETIEVNPAEGHKLKLTPNDFKTITDAALEMVVRQ